MPGVGLFDFNLIAIHPCVEEECRESEAILFHGPDGGNESECNLNAIHAPESGWPARRATHR
ncbi:hypothetical protein [Burkholderia cepacia]|uniref:hypothetical protein n=1 Tax=Burkholderia cepacia TaxID=292 RepID=UPI0018B0AAD0|nr:hypothetical protein [Burkholderia cepacia]